MKTIILFIAALTLAFATKGQSFQEGEIRAHKNAYMCRISQTVSSSRNAYHMDNKVLYEFTNTENVLHNHITGMLGPDPPAIVSNRLLLELLYEVYGGREAMQAMDDEKIHFLFFIGMDHRVKEIRITISTTKLPVTTIYQVETIENVIKERIRFDFDTRKPTYRDAIYNISSSEWVLSKIPDALETGLYYSSLYRSYRKIEKFYDRGEFKANDNIYICRVFNVSDYIRGDTRNWYRFSNIKNELFRGAIPSMDTPTMKSERILLEILYKVYGGREQMQALTDEELRIAFFVGSDGRIREMQISIRTHEEPVLTIYQIESIESLLKEYLIFEVDPIDQAFGYTLPAYSNRIVISEIPDILEE